MKPYEESKQVHVGSNEYSAYNRDRVDGMQLEPKPKPERKRRRNDGSSGCEYSRRETEGQSDIGFLDALGFNDTPSDH